MKIRVLHIIVGLNLGGAELMLFRLVKNSSDFEHIVVSLTDLGKIGSRFDKLGVRVIHLGITRDWVFLQFSKLFELYKVCKSMKPDIVQTWMYHADFFGGLISMISGCKSIVWNIRNNNIPQGRISFTGIIISLCAFFSFYVPKKIICVGESVSLTHARLGYDMSKMVVINNGYEFNLLEYNTNFERGVFVVGIIGRFDLLKGYDIFLSSLQYYFKSGFRQTKIVMAGRGITLNNLEFSSLFNKYDLPIDCFEFLDEVDSVSTFYSKINLLVSSSISEGFPNVIVEAMSFGVPCLVTDVGESSNIVGDCGWVVPPNNSLVLHDTLIGISEISQEKLKNIGNNARLRVLNNFSISLIVDKYETLYNNLTTNNS